MVSFTQEDLMSGNFSLEDLKKKFEELSMQELSGPVKARVSVLKQLQKEHRALEIELENQVFALERSFDAKFAAFYAQRKAMVEGSAACPEAVAAGEEASAPGIKGFWLSALMNNSLFKSIIQEQDMDVLEHLSDIRVVYPSATSRSFQIEFEFSDAAKEYFDEKVLVKKVTYEEDESERGTFSLKGTEGTPIHWKAGKSCTVQLVSKTQRHKTKNITRTVEREEPCPSFFNFFDEIKPAKIEGDEEDEEAEQEAAEEFEAMLEMDYELAQTLKERIIPNAVDYFLGLAMDDEEGDEEGGCDSCGEDHDDDYTDGEDDDEEDDDEDEDDEDGEEMEEIPRARRVPKGPAANAAKPECQQQ